MPEPLESALDEVRAAVLDADRLVRAVGSGRRSGTRPEPSRVVLRVVDLKAGRRLQVVSTTASGPVTRNVEPGAAGVVVDELLALPLGNWHVETSEATLQLRVTKRGEAQLHRGAAVAGSGGVGGAQPARPHDREKERLIDPADPLFTVLGAAAGKRRQVDAFLRLAEPVVRKTFDETVPLRLVDLGCGNAYLTLAAHRYLRARRPGTTTVGVELRPDLVQRSTDRAAAAGLDGLMFVEGSIGDVDPGLDRVDVVLALHACDTATDEALARAVRWRAPVVLAAPCCHHDIQRQLARGGAVPGPAPYGAITRHPILRERFADVLTDALRAALLRLLGYRVDVVEFVDSRHTPRNALIRAVRTGASPTAAQVEEYRDLVRQWGVVPDLARRLEPELSPVL